MRLGYVTTTKILSSLVLVVAVTLPVVATSDGRAIAADPPRLLAFGAFPQTRGNQTQRQATEQLEAQIGRQLEVVRVFEKWQDPFPDAFHQWLHDTDHTPIVSIKPVRANGTRITWAALAAAGPGTQVDTEMRSWARRLRDFGNPIYVTLHHEPEASANTQYGTAAEFVAAWRHWVDVLRQEGAGNVRFMFITTSYSYSLPTSDRRFAPKWYPGDDWVDSIGIDAYNWHVCRPNQDNAWKTVAEMIEPFRQFGALHPSKDLWLTEWASWDDPAVPGRKAQWIDQARVLFAQPAYSQFVGVSYFNSGAINTDFPNCQWWVDTSASSLASFATMANDPLWQGDAFGEPPPPDPLPPVAAFSAACDGLSCTLNSTSHDPDGVITQLDWQFGDGGSSTGTDSSPSHTYADPGTYTVTLTVTDDDAITSSVAHDVTVDHPPATAEPVFRASSSANSSGTAASVVVPPGVVPGDRLLLIVTANVATTATTPTGWTLLGTRSDGNPDIRSWVFTRVAAAGAAGSTVTSRLATSAKSSRVLLAYSSAGAPVATSTVAGPSSTAHATPPAAAASGATVVSYWSDKTATNTGWTVPLAVQLRASSVGTGSGRITAAIGDTAHAPANWAGATATSTASSAKAIMWSIVISPA